jgi:protocatechuate 3,4-dioxygenase beta subunit
MSQKQTLTTLGTLVVSSVVTVVLFVAPRAQTALPAQSGSATISGVVRDSASSQPLQGATVTLYGLQFVEGRITAVTDDRGAFTFPRLDGGLYALRARKDGFADVGHRQRRFGSAPLFRVLDGQHMAVDLSLPLTSAVTGILSDERGNPIARATVRALRYNRSAGYLSPQQAGSALSDDGGVYRIHSLQPGEYGICALTKATLPLTEPQHLQAEIDRLLWHLNLATSPGSDEVHRESVQRIAALEAKLPDRIDPVYGYAPRCTPQPFSPAPVKITVGPGEQLSGVDIQFPLTRLARLDGMVTALPQEGGPSFDLSVVLIAEEVRDVQRMESARLGPSRRFRFTNVAPGEYYLMVHGSPPGGGRLRLFASMPVVVKDTDVRGLVLAAPRPATVSGRVLFNGGAVPSPSALEGVRVYLAPSPNRPATRYQIRSADLEPDGTFRVSDVFPGAYQVSLSTIGREGWASERSTWGAQDVFEQPLHVRAGETVTDVTIHAVDRVSEVTGTILDEQGEPATDYLLLAYPVDERYWNAHSHRMPSTRAGRDGRFRLPILHPGQYRLATLLDVEYGAWFDPEFVRALEPMSPPISIAAREKKEMHLRVPRPK